VFLAEPTETPYDLRWRMFGVRVRVHPFFWLMSVLLGWNAYSGPGGSLEFLAVWVGCVFVSILLHEFGHVWMGQLFGSRGHIVLYGFGGLAIGSNQLSRRWQRILVLLAGPGIQLLLAAGLLGLRFFLPPEQGLASWGPYAKEAFWDLIWINLFWAIMNLLPVFPLDGGQVSREVCQAASPQRGGAFAMGLSMVLAAAIALHALLEQRSPLPAWIPSGTYIAILFALLAVTSFQALQMENERQRYLERVDEDLPWER
jgi:stage IV sporulation protein FB